MKKLKRILFVSQGLKLEEQALFDWTLRLAQQHQSQVDMIRVIPELGAGLSYALESISPAKIQAEQDREAQQELHDLYIQAKQQSLKTHTQLLRGKSFYRTIQYAQQHQADLVVKIAQPVSKGLADKMFVSDDMHLLRKCPVPVLLHKQGHPLPFKRVMASLGLDLDQQHAHPSALNQDLLDWASSLVQPSEPVYVAHAWQSETEEIVRHWHTELSEVELMRLVERERHLHHEVMEKELAELRKTERSIHVLFPKGEPEHAIPTVAERNEVDLIVMGTLGRVGLPGLVIGNTAENILEQVQCSVLAIKPQGFKTPVDVQS